MNEAAKIEVINLRRFENGKLKAFADLMFDGSYIIKGFRIVEGEDGLFVGFPQERGKNGRWYDVFQVTSEDAKNRISKAVLASYTE